jgi:D-lyxose ketol-isomerase
LLNPYCAYELNRSRKKEKQMKKSQSSQGFFLHSHSWSAEDAANAKGSTGDVNFYSEEDDEEEDEERENVSPHLGDNPGR